MYYFKTLKRERIDTSAYTLQASLTEKVVVDGHDWHTTLNFGVKAKENQDKVTTLYWLPKRHKNPNKQGLLQIIFLASFGTARDAKRRSLGRIFLSYPHTHDRVLYSNYVYRYLFSVCQL